MDRKSYVLAVLSASDGFGLNPVQAQKLFFLLDRKAAHLLSGPHFNFEPEGCGPFDKAIASDLRELEREGDVEIEIAPRILLTKKYRPSERGLQRGRELLKLLSGEAQNYVRDLSAWVRGQDFTSLVTAIYHEYPEMAVNGVFRDRP